GQNVNKLSTRATLLLDFEDATTFDESQKRRIRTQLVSRLARDGRLRVVSQRGRTQAENRRLAEARLLDLLTAALAVRKRRRLTRPTAASRERRLKAKRLRGERKRQRGAPPPGDD
ncbi:MAG: aminoacyl-tRNA hydrolase, partial [Planctomycetota bacterium]